MLRLTAREDAAKLLAQSLGDKQGYDELRVDHPDVCRCWTALLEGVRIPRLELPPRFKATKKDLRDTTLWLHPMTLQLCFSSVHEFHDRVPRLPLAHIRSVQSGRVSTKTPLAPYPCLSLTTWQNDVLHVGFAHAASRDAVVSMLDALIKVLDVMARVQDQVTQHLKRRDSVDGNQAPRWTPVDLEQWLHDRHLSALYVPVYEYLMAARAFDGDGDAYARFLYLSDETIQAIVTNQSNQEGAAVMELRVALLHQLQLAREPCKRRSFWPKIF
ncbi:hypothetical protein ACHHYP_14279 [Achlya hypogyna]|uniref:Uncharacterized protein n=1 Tax=Achlya hypogyna TaxID=1202772 RepID=A0A1V9YDK1_ACHHY|nr:hypothetical protein ACHHYP_14279 [Achlya hypogyna]